MSRKSSKSEGRASPSAIAKRRTARELNTLLLGGAGPSQLDGRTEKRRQRLIKELIEGRRGQPLKPIQVLLHTAELMDLGETLSSLRKAGVKPRKFPANIDVAAVIDKTQAAYGFPLQAWKLLGVSVSSESKPRGGPGRRKPL